MHLPNETTSQKADGEFGLPEQTGEENRRLTSASKSEPGRKSKRDKSITQREEDQAGRGERRRPRREEGEGSECTLLRTSTQSTPTGGAWWGHSREADAARPSPSGQVVEVPTELGV
jgi:hypothetical protein